MENITHIHGLPHKTHWEKKRLASTHFHLLSPTLTLLCIKYIFLEVPPLIFLINFYFCIKYSHYFTPQSHLYHQSMFYHMHHFTFISNPFLYNHLFGLHIYCTWVVKFSLTHKQRSKHILCIKCGNLKLHICGAHLNIYVDGCAQHWWPLLCGISSFGHSHTQLVEIMDINFFTLFTSVLFMHCYANKKCPVNYECLEIMSILWHIVLQWWVICGHNFANGTRVHMSPHHYDVLSKHPKLYKKLMDSYCSDLEWCE